MRPSITEHALASLSANLKDCPKMDRKQERGVFFHPGMRQLNPCDGCNYLPGVARLR